jgi:cellulose synthase/poly-beta-1,6-N-acetylglucosamine synthase-like glycosyltransferase
MTTALLILASAVALYYAMTLLAAPFARDVPLPAAVRTRFAILIPAHNEESTLPATLTSVTKLDYPHGLVECFVIVDNCTDSTATTARAFGVTVLERSDDTHRGKGHALAFALDVIPFSDFDSVMIFDADGELDAQALRRFDARFQHGAAAVQGSIRTRNAADSTASLVAGVGNVLDDWMSQGRGTLGRHVPLRGTAMAFTTATLARCPWRCYGLTEDAEYSTRLARAGIRVEFEPAVQARSESAASTADLAPQRRRWRAALADPRRWIESKPLVLLQLMLATAAAMLTGEIELMLWSAGLWLLNVAMYAAALSRLDAVSFARLAIAPLVVLRLAGITLAGIVHKEQAWRRTRRTAEA